VQLNLTKIAPLAVPLTKNGAAVPGKWLMQPLLKVYGKKVKELDGSESNQEFDENAQNQNFIAKYFLIPTNTTSGDVLTFTIPEALEEGYYKLSADISAYTEFPTLVALSGECAAAGDASRAMCVCMGGGVSHAAMHVWLHALVGRRELCAS
jgi:hypothetical protein